MILIIVEAVLEQRDKMLSKIAHDVYTETGSYLAVASIFCFLKRTLKMVCLIFFCHRLDISRIKKLIINLEFILLISSTKFPLNP